MNLVNINVGTAVSIAIRASSSLTLKLLWNCVRSSLNIQLSNYSKCNTNTISPKTMMTQTLIHTYIYINTVSCVVRVEWFVKQSKGDTKILNNLALGWALMWYFLVKCFYVCTSSNSESNTSICFWWIYCLNVTQYNHNTNY